MLHRLGQPGFVLQNIPGAAPSPALRAGLTTLPRELLDLWCKTTPFCPNEMLPAEMAGLGWVLFTLMASQRAELVRTKLLQMFPSKVLKKTGVSLKRVLMGKGCISFMFIAVLGKQGAKSRNVFSSKQTILFQFRGLGWDRHFYGRNGFFLPKSSISNSLLHQRMLGGVAW